MPRQCQGCKHWQGDDSKFMASCPLMGRRMQFDDYCTQWEVKPVAAAPRNYSGSRGEPMEYFSKLQVFRYGVSLQDCYGDRISQEILDYLKSHVIVPVVFNHQTLDLDDKIPPTLLGMPVVEWKDAPSLEGVTFGDWSCWFSPADTECLEDLEDGDEEDEDREDEDEDKEEEFEDFFQ